MNTTKTKKIKTDYHGGRKAESETKMSYAKISYWTDDGKDLGHIEVMASEQPLQVAKLIKRWGKLPAGSKPLKYGSQNKPAPGHPVTVIYASGKTRQV